MGAWAVGGLVADWALPPVSSLTSLTAITVIPKPKPKPWQWEELQTLGRAAEAAGRDPWYALRQQGVQCSEAAFVYLSPRQLEALCAELERACAALDATAMEAAAFYIRGCLMRARVANNRMPSRRR